MASSIYDVVFGANTIRQCQNTQFNSGIQTIAGRSSGAIDPSALYVLSGDPRLTVDSFDLATVLTALGASGYASVLSGTITVPFNERANGSTFAGTGSHNRINGTNALAHITSISGNQGDEGSQASLEIAFMSSNGLAAPVTWSTDQNLGAQSFIGQYAMGPVLLTIAEGAEVELTGVVSHTVRPGITISPTPTSGGLYASRIYVPARDPMIEITFIDMDQLNVYAPLFAALDAVRVFHRKRQDGGTFVADATAEHVCASFGEALSATDGISHRQNDNGTASLMIRGKSLTLSSTTAIASE